MAHDVDALSDLLDRFLRVSPDLRADTLARLIESVTSLSVIPVPVVPCGSTLAHPPHGWFRANWPNYPQKEALDCPGVTPVPCPEGFHWIGQTFAACDRCSLPAWDHAGVAELTAPVFSTEPAYRLRPWNPGEADRIRETWAPR